jgi:hypothetical protein
MRAVAAVSAGELHVIDLEKLADVALTSGSTVIRSDGRPANSPPPKISSDGAKRAAKVFCEFTRKALTPQLMVCYLLRRHYALSQVRVS